MKDNLFFPVIIVGGGPAGAATSLTLASRGIRHCLVESSLSAKPKPGEAIPPNAKPLFKQLGIDQLLMSEKHVPYYGNKSSWGNIRLEQKEFIEDRFGESTLLNRTFFEGQLRSMIDSSYCTEYFGYKLSHVTNVDEGVDVAIAKETQKLNLKGQYIVDATGKKATVCRHLGVQKTSLDQQFAITFQVRHYAKIPSNIYIESGPDGWWYAAPIGKDALCLMFFTLKSIIPSSQLLLPFIQQTIQDSIHVRALLGDGYSISPDVKVVPAGSSFLRVPYGPNWLAVGDAAYSFDPISSYGITSSLAAGYYGGHALADCIEGKTDGLAAYRFVMENAFRAYLEKLEKHYDLEKRWLNQPYWANRFDIQQNAINERVRRI